MADPESGPICPMCHEARLGPTHPDWYVLYTAGSTPRDRGRRGLPVGARTCPGASTSRSSCRRRSTRRVVVRAPAGLAFVSPVVQGRVATWTPSKSSPRTPSPPSCSSGLERALSRFDQSSKASARPDALVTDAIGVVVSQAPRTGAVKRPDERLTEDSRAVNPDWLTSR